MLLISAVLHLMIGIGHSGDNPCSAPATNPVARIIQESPAFRVAVTATVAGQLGPDRTAIQPTIDSLTVLVYKQACSELTIVQPAPFPDMRLGWFTAYYGLEKTIAIFGVTHDDTVILLSPISAGTLRAGLDLGGWQAVAPPLAADASDSAITQYACVVLMLAGNHGVPATCKTPWRWEIHRTGHLTVRAVNEPFELVFDQTGQLIELKGVGA